MGIKEESEEYIIGASLGVFKTRSVRRRPDSEKFDLQQLLAVKGLPWQPQPNKEGDFRVMPAEVLIIPVESGVPPPPVTAEPQIRRLCIKKEDVMKHGYCQGCPGCQAIRLGRSAARHSDACRMRIEEAIKRSDPERLQRTDDSINQEIARRVEESDRKRKQ